MPTCYGPQQDEEFTRRMHIIECRDACTLRKSKVGRKRFVDRFSTVHETVRFDVVSV
jgi:hypothetical protein